MIWTFGFGFKLLKFK